MVLKRPQVRGFGKQDAFLKPGFSKPEHRSFAIFVFGVWCVTSRSLPGYISFSLEGLFLLF